MHQPPPPRSRLDASTLAWLALLIGAVAVYALGLGGQYIPTNGDEMVYTHIARLTAESGHWLPLVSDLDNMRNTKPPLLFWLIQAGWALFGVQAWWLRLIAPLFAAGTLALTVPIARQLWPDRPDAARIAPLVLLSSLLTVPAKDPAQALPPATAQKALDALG